MPHSSRDASHSRIRLLLAALGLAVVAALTLAPRSIVAPARRAFMRLMEPLIAPILPAATYNDLEILLNALLFIPLGAGIALILPRGLWLLAPFTGMAVSFAVEFLQARIPGRVPDLDDVLWNSVGALVGAVAVGIVRLAGRGARRRVAPPARPGVSGPIARPASRVP